WAKDRWFSEDTRPGVPTSGLTTVGQWGNWRRQGAAAADPWYAPNRGSDALDESDFHVQTNEDTSRSSDQMHLRTPQERRSLFATADFEITDNVRFTSDMS